MKRSSHNFVFSVRNFVSLELQEPAAEKKVSWASLSLDPAVKSRGKLFSYKKTKIDSSR